MKQEVVAAQKVAIQQAQDAALEAGLGACYDQGVQDQQGQGSGGLSQADLDKAVADALAAAKVVSDQALADLQSQMDAKLEQVKADDAKALQDAQAQAAQDLSAVQQALADMTAKEQLEEAVVNDLKVSIDKVQASFDAIKSLLFPGVSV